MTRHSLIARRKVSGYTQEQFAEALMVAVSTVRRWESGTSAPQPWQQPRICRLLDITRTELANMLTGDDREPRSAGSTEAEVAPVNRRQFVGAASIAGVSVSTPSEAKGRRIGRSDVTRFRERVSELRRLDDFQGGASVYPSAVKELQALSRLAINGSFSQTVGRELLSTLAELYEVASWTAFDAGRTSDAKRLAQTASTAASQAGNRALASIAMSQHSYYLAGDAPAKAVAMAKASLTAADGSVPPVVRILLVERLAWAQARTGSTSGADRALGASEDLHDERDNAAGEHEPSSLYWISRDESRVKAGRCWAELRDPNRAVPILEELAAPYEDTHARSLSRYSAWLAGSYVDAGDIEAATVSARRAVDLSHQTASPRTDALLKGVLKRFEPHQEKSGVRELLAAARF